MAAQAHDDDEKRDIAIAMVATSSTRLPPAEKIVAAAGGPSKKSRSLLGRLFGAKPAAAEGASAEQQWEGTNLVFKFRDGMIAVALMPGPIPWADLEGPCATSWWWPEATDKMRGHKYHFIVTVMGGTIPPVERRVILTNLCAAVIRNSDAVGVYWAEGTLVHAPEAFLEQSEGISATAIMPSRNLKTRFVPSHCCSADAPSAAAGLAPNSRPSRLRDFFEGPPAAATIFSAGGSRVELVATIAIAMSPFSSPSPPRSSSCSLIR